MKIEYALSFLVAMALNGCGGGSGTNVNEMVPMVPEEEVVEGTPPVASQPSRAVRASYPRGPTTPNFEAEIGDYSDYGLWMNSFFSKITVFSEVADTNVDPYITGYTKVNSEAPLAKNVDISGARYSGKVAGYVEHSTIIDTATDFDVNVEYELLTGSISLSLGQPLGGIRKGFARKEITRPARDGNGNDIPGRFVTEIVADPDTPAWNARWPVNVSFSGNITRYIGSARGEVSMSQARVGVAPIVISADGSTTGLSGFAYDDSGTLFFGGTVWSHIRSDDQASFSGVWEAQ